MASSFYNKITRKVSRGSGADSIAESIGGQAQKVGDSLVDQQASQDYQTSQAGNQLGSQLTSAIGQALQAYGQAKKDFTTNSITDTKKAQLNKLRSTIESETDPEKQKELIDAAIEDKSYINDAIKKYSDAGHGGNELKNIIDGVQGERQRYIRGAMKTNIENMAKLDKERWAFKKNSVVNDITRSYRTPAADTDSGKSFLKDIKISSKGPLDELMKTKDFARDSLKSNLDEALNEKYTDHEFVKKELAKPGARAVLTPKEYTAYINKANKLKAEDRSPVKSAVKHLGKVSKDAEGIKLMFDSVETDTNLPPSIRSIFSSEKSGFTSFLNGGNANYFTDRKLRLGEEIKKMRLGSKDSEILYSKMSEVQDGLQAMAKTESNKARLLFGGGQTKGIFKDDIDSINRAIVTTFDTSTLPGPELSGIKAETALAAASVQTIYGEDQNNQRAVRALYDKSDRLQPLLKVFKDKEIKSIMTGYNKLFKDRLEFNDMTRSFDNSQIIGTELEADPEQIRFESTLLGYIDARSDYGPKWDELLPYEKRVKIEKASRKRVRQHIKRGKK